MRQLRTPLYVLLGIVGLTMIVLPAPLSAQSKRKHYNFVVMMADDLGAKELGCYGHPDHQTPHFDQLAAEGMRFRTCYSTPICSSTRVMIMTGRYGFRTGYFNFINRTYSPLTTSPQYEIGSKITFADVLGAAGYATALVGKWQLTGQVPSMIHECGFDEYHIWAYTHNLPEGVQHTGGWEGKPDGKTARYWHPSIMQNGRYMPTSPQDYGPDLFADFIIDFARRHQKEPFFIYYPMCLTHSPWDHTPDLKHPGQKTPKGLKYNVEYLDHVVGRIVEALDGMGLSENTIVLFTGDNGTGKSGKGTVTELGARVPLIVRCPGTVGAGVVSDELVDLTDVLPTLAEFAGAKLPKDHVIDGVSLVPTLRDGNVAHREWIFSYLADGRILRDKRWLLEGNGHFYDCGNNRNHMGYEDVTNSSDPEVLAARKRFDRILEDLPGPEGFSGLVQPKSNSKKSKKQKKKAASNR